MSGMLLLFDDGRSRLSVPVGFTYTPPFNIYSDGTTSFRFDSLYDAIDPADITDYYVSPSGASGNDGLTPSTPKRAISGILTTAGGASTPWVRINLANGDYGLNYHPGIAFPDKNVIFRGAGGQIYIGVFIRGTGLTWTLTTGTTYSAARSNVYQVRDYASLNSYGDPRKYTLAASQAACEATPYSYFQSGATVYVNNGVGRPDANQMLLLSATNTRFTPVDKTFICDAGASGRIDFIGGLTSCVRIIGGNSQKYYARNVWYKFSPGDNLEAIGCFSLLQGGGASGSGLDCLNYHWNTGAGNSLPTAIEIGVSAYDAGVSGGTQNCSTMHDGGTIIRVNGSYNGSLGPVVADVNDGTQSWNIRCDARNSLLNSGVATDASWCVFTGTAKMWLDRCTYGAGVSTSEYDLTVDAGCTMYLRGTLEGNSSVAGTLTTY